VILERIVANLVSNAIRYTHSGRVLLGCRRRGASVRIELWDSGVGIAAEHRDSVFQEFFQLHNPERDRSKGLGLGLSIVKRSASLLGHPLHVWSEVGKGSCFAIEVPRAPASVLPVQPAVDLSASPDLVSGSFIVVIDDEQDIRFAMESVLQRWGCHVVCAGSAEEAVGALQAHLRAPDLIISDYRLRDNQTGIDALMRIREAIGENVPAIIITGDSAAGDIRQVSQLGLPLAHKPVSAEHLRGLIADTLVRTRATTAGTAQQ
jgi:CheY-like chemotaxis protein